jgi:7-cyano-7-deazaguanine tRNA-ribosyltransferase
MFELKARDGLGKIGIFHTKHGDIKTPALMPVINPNQQLVSPSEMKELFKTEILITNSYIIYKNKELREKAESQGVHHLLDFDGAVMTDSGTFQSHIYGDVEVGPQEIVEFQKRIGSDIGTILDVFSEPDDSEEKVKTDLEETISRAQKAIKIKGDMALALPVQGSIFPELRTYCAGELSKLSGEFYPIGGVVPLMENYRFAELVDVIIAAKKGLSPSKPVHLFGCGHPMLFGLAALLGCDFFDSASYAKYAKDGRMLFPDGTRRIEEIIELPCSCPVCSSHDIDSFKESYKQGDYKPLALHNLYINFAEISGVRQAIYEGRLWEYIEMRARAHPYLLSALKRIGHHKKFLERFENISKSSAFFYTGAESVNRPLVYRYEKRFFERYSHPKTGIQVGFDEGKRPYSKYYKKEISRVRKVCNAHFIVNSIFGPAPIELDEMYPIGQSVIPEELESTTHERMRRLMERHSHRGLFQFAVMWDGDETLEFLKTMGGKEEDMLDLDRLRVRGVSDMQFGNGASDALFKGEMKLIKSKKTDKIRNVLVNGEHILSMRASDGMFTLKIPGAKLLHKGFPPQKLRVVVEDDSVEFNREGKNVFAKFVVECDDEIRPMDEVLIVNKKDELIAIGRALMNREEMLCYKIGIAVKVREGIKI